jgi:cytochrome c-type biogenesis protein CcmH
MRLLRILSFVLLYWAGSAAVAHAVQPDEILADPIKEARARELSKELRCMVCQNQSIDDSDAPLARDLRLLVRERVTAGDTDSQVVDFLVARYGEFVLLKPRFNPHTVLLWLLPPLALMGGGIALWVYSNRRRRAGASDEESALQLTPEEVARLEKLLASDPSVGSGEPHP